MTENKRTLYFMLSALGIALSIALFTWFSSKNWENRKTNSSGKSPELIQETIKNEIKTLSELQSVSPQMYNNLRIEIVGYYEQGDITEVLQKSLLNELKDAYVQKSVTEAKLLLTKDPLDETKINSFINHWGIIGAYNRDINEVKAAIQWYNYYVHTLPSKINALVHSNLTDIEDINNTPYALYKKELAAINDSRFKYFNTVKKVNEEGNTKLNKFYNQWQEINENGYNEW
jgi:hypothetical protein